MAISQAEIVTITETGVADPITVTLTETDLPFGRAREFAAFESGGENEIPEDGIRLPGSGRVIFQVLYSKQRPFVIKGAFRDSQTATTGHARSMRNQLESIRLRGNLVSIKWEGDERTGILKETKFGEESFGDISYELNFLVALGPNTKTIESQSESPPSVLSDVADMQTKAAQMRIDALASALPADIRLGITTSLSGITQSLEDLNSKISNYEDIFLTAPSNATAALNGLASQAFTTLTAINGVMDQMNSARPGSVASQTASDVNSIWSFLFSNETILLDMKSRLRDVVSRVFANQPDKQKLYEVREGDTLEDIAQSQLGSRGRAGDLGVREDQLAPGTLISIPRS